MIIIIIIIINNTVVIPVLKEITKMYRPTVVVIVVISMLALSYWNMKTNKECNVAKNTFGNSDIPQSYLSKSCAGPEWGPQQYPMQWYQWQSYVKALFSLFH
jgi:hypothetical protein